MRGGAVRAWAPSCRDAQAPSVLQLGPEEGGPWPPEKLAFRSISPLTPSLLEEGAPGSRAGPMGSLGCVWGRCAGGQLGPDTAPASSEVGGSSHAGPAGQAVSVAPGLARTSHRSGW